MASKNIRLVTNEPGRRNYPSWIDQFVELTKGLESAPIFRRWTAITTIGAVLQRKVHVDTQGILYPNLYTFLVGAPGIGKSRSINVAHEMLLEITEIKLSPTSMTMASLVDKLVEAKRSIPVYTGEGLEYHSLFVMADELSNFMNDFKGQNDLVSGLTKFYDCSHYSQSRRVGNIERVINKPQVSILAGSTPSNIIHFIPEWAWDQGFTSRIFMIFSADRPLVNPFEEPKLETPDEMIEDLQVMDKLVGRFGYTKEYATVAQTWRSTGMDPAPTHPKLESYVARRWAHLLKLSMIASVDRGNDLTLTIDDFKRAQHWMLEAEHYMPEIFKAAAPVNTDSKVMDEIQHFVSTHPQGCPEHLVKNFARTRVNAMAIMPTLNMMEQANMIYVIALDRLGCKIYGLPNQAKAQNQ